MFIPISLKMWEQLKSKVDRGTKIIINTLNLMRNFLFCYKYFRYATYMQLPLKSNISLLKVLAKNIIPNILNLILLCSLFNYL